MKKAYSSNINVDCSYYPEQGKYALINNTAQPQKTIFYDINGKKKEVILQKGDISWQED